MRAQVNAAVAASLLSLVVACAQRVAPEAPGPAPSDTESAAVPAAAEPGTDEDSAGAESAKQALRGLFERCAAREYAEAARCFLYSGSDTSRTNKSAMSIDDPGEAAAVEARCANLAGLVESSGGYAIVGHERDPTGDGVWHRLLVSFSTPGSPTKKVFSLLESNGAYLLGAVE